MPTLIYSADAADDLDAILVWGVANGYGDPVEFVDELIERVSMLMDQPKAGKPGRVSGTRELVLDDLKLIVVYVETKQAVEIVRVLHGSQQFPVVAVRAAVSPHNFGAQTQQAQKGVRMHKKSK